MKKKRIFSFFAVIVSMLTVFSGCSIIELTSCSSCQYKAKQIQFESGDFIYTYTDEAGTRRGHSDGKYIVILELTYEGEQKDTIIVPNEINGKSVVQLGMSGFMVSFDLIGTNSRIYLPSSLICVGGMYAGMDTKVFFNKKPSYEFIYNYSQCRYMFVSEKVNEEFKTEYDDTITLIANVEYIVDSETYWLDDYDEESLITAPPKPEKDGYEFAGWYKETECINEWDFEVDKVPGKTVNEDGTENINSTRLYAKWQKI